MSSHPPSLGDTFALMRASLQADSVSRPHAAGALNAVMTALIFRLLAELEHLFRLWAARAAARSAASRTTRIAGLPFVPRPLRHPPLPTWLLRGAPAKGLRRSPAPRPQSGTLRAYPLRNAPH